MAISIAAGREDNSWVRRIQAGASAAGRALVAVTAVLCWLAAMPAMAQQPGADPAPAASPAGESATAPSFDFSDRKQLLIVGSTSMEPITDAVIKRLVRDYVMPQPVKRLTGTESGIKEFCAGVGAGFPDIVAASHRMSRAEFDVCRENNVLDVIEVMIGQNAIVVVAGKATPIFNVTPRMMYFAVAENLPAKGEFAANPNKSWKDTGNDAPDLPIHVVVPPEGSGTRAFFNDAFMQGGCRHLKDIDAIFAADVRVERCTKSRDDGVITELGGPLEARVDAVLKGAPGTVAILPWNLYLSVRDKLEVLPVSKVVPTHVSIAEYNYEMATTLDYYFKRAHMRNNAGRGVVRGIREFMAELVKDEATGEAGYIEDLGVVALTPEERRKQNEIVRRLKRFDP